MTITKPWRVECDACGKVTLYANILKFQSLVEKLKDEAWQFTRKDTGWPAKWTHKCLKCSNKESAVQPQNFTVSNVPEVKDV